MNRVGKLMEKITHFRLRTQLLLLFMAVLLFVLSLSSGFIYTGVIRILQKQSEDSTVQMFKQAEYSILEFRKNVDKVSRILLVDEQIQKFLDKTGPFDGETVDIKNDVFKVMDRFIRNYDFIYSICIYGDGGRVIGASSTRNIQMEDYEKQTPIYSSDIFQTARRQNPYIVWGMEKAELFNEVGTTRDTTEPPYFISAVRSIKSIRQPDQTATLVINTDEKRLSSICGSFTKNAGNQIYILDRSGKIISHGDKKLLGIRSPLAEKLDPELSYGSFQAGDRQIIHYAIEGTGWIIVNEIPMTLYTSDLLTLRATLLIILVLGAAVSMILTFFWIRRVTEPVLSLKKAMTEAGKGNLAAYVDNNSKDELGMLNHSFNRMLSGLEQTLDQNRKMEEEKRKLEIEVLQSRINPHFLLNTLNTIKWMAVMAGAGNVAEVITSLGNMISPIFRNPSILCTLGEEVEYVESYRKIMNSRYGKSISVEYFVPEELKACKVLRFILQPIIENSLVHGMDRINHAGVISIRALKDESVLEITVEDNGSGMPAEVLESLRIWINIEREASAPEDGSGFGIGLMNVNRRIRLHFGMEYGIRIDSREGEGTQVKVRIPRIEPTNPDDSKDLNPENQ